MRVGHVSELDLIFSVKSLDLLKNLEWVMFNRLLKCLLKYLLVNNFDDEIQIFNHLLMMFLKLFLLLVIFLHLFVKFLLFIALLGFFRYRCRRRLSLWFRLRRWWLINNFVK